MTTRRIKIIIAIVMVLTAVSFLTYYNYSRLPPPTKLIVCDDGTFELYNTTDILVCNGTKVHPKHLNQYTPPPIKHTENITVDRWQ